MASVDPSPRSAARKARARVSNYPLLGASAAAMTVFDAAVMGQGFVAAALLATVVVGVLPKWFLLHRFGLATGPTFRLGLVLSLCAIAIMVTINFNNKLAQQRANTLVSAIAHYRALAGHYPPALDDLVPVYIDAVPRAKYTLSFNRFEYDNFGERVMLSYADAPPFGRIGYDFSERRWLSSTP